MKQKKIAKYVWRFVSLSVCMLLFFMLKLKDQEPVIREKNQIINAEHLAPVFDKLLELKNDSTKAISVLHIGDSHIQGNYITDKIRNSLYKEFGLASKGLVFPFQVAHTNTMAEVRSSSSQKWEVKRNVQLDESDKLGVSGRAIISTTTNATIKLRVPYSYKNYFFNEVDILYTPKISSSLTVKDSSGHILHREYKKNEDGFVVESFKSEAPIHLVTFQTSKPTKYTLHGLVLKNSKRGGITYNVAGVNGAQYKNWAASNILAKQSSYLKPDLIIISLGTNDANDTLLSVEDFTKYMNRLISELRKVNPKACFILTTPPDSWYKRIHVNKKIDEMRKAILAYAQDQNIACWDLYEIMGGENSIKTWLNQGLAAQDLIHFSKAGYELQGQLFFESFINHYTTYASDRSR